MELSGLTIRNFRNLASLDLELPSAGVVVLGDNGQGKTNLLEAMYYLVLFRSLRGAKDRELVRFGEEAFFVGGRANGGAFEVRAGYESAGRRKKISLDGNPVTRISDAVGKILAVSFAPSDRGIVAGPATGRRRYLDVLLSLAEPGYLARLTEMRSALKQRNAALRRGRGDEARAFDEPLASAGARVLEARTRWVERWSPRFGALTAALGERAEARMRYRTHRPPTADARSQFLDLLASHESRDLRRGMTTAGPHRDDLELSLEGRELRMYGSAGQQRTAAIALRLVEAETLRDSAGSPPIALYDDVFAELDEDRQARLLNLIHETLPGQAIVAAPRESEVPASMLDRPRWRVKGGRVAA